jgi:hypothetical protein
MSSWRVEKNCVSSAISPVAGVDPGDLENPLEKMALEQCLNVRHQAAA